MKICLVCSHGGHLVQMLWLRGAFKKHDSFLVTYNSKATKNLENTYLIKFEGWDLMGEILLIKTLMEAFKILIKEKPDVIVSTGGGEIAVPFCYIGKAFGAKVVFIETLSRITTPSRGGRLVYPIADLFLVQWDSLLEKYGTRAKYWGKVI